MHQFPNEWNVAAGKSNESKFTASTVSVRRSEEQKNTKQPNHAKLYGENYHANYQ